MLHNTVYFDKAVAFRFIPVGYAIAIIPAVISFLRYKTLTLNGVVFTAFSIIGLNIGLAGSYTYSWTFHGNVSAFDPMHTPMVGFSVAGVIILTFIFGSIQEAIKFVFGLISRGR